MDDVEPFVARTTPHAVVASGTLRNGARSEMCEAPKGPAERDRDGQSSDVKLNWWCSRDLAADFTVQRLRSRAARRRIGYHLFWNSLSSRVVTLSLGTWK